MNMAGLGSEEYWSKQNEIPGSTRVPINEIVEYFSPKSPSRILDIGAGSGRSTKELKKNFPNSKIIAFDISSEGIKTINPEVANRIEGTALKLPIEKESIDCVILCGVMTNITDKDPAMAQRAREELAIEVNRVLKEDGICIISDFNNEHLLSQYPINYRRHALITGELGTIAVFDPKAKISFVGRTDEEVKKLAKSEHLRRLAHHYSPKELIEIFSKSGTKALGYSVEIGKTPSNTPIDNIVVTLTKPKKAHSPGVS